MSTFKRQRHRLLNCKYGLVILFSFSVTTNTKESTGVIYLTFSSKDCNVGGYCDKEE